MIHSKKKKKILKNNKDCENLKGSLFYNTEYNNSVQNNMHSYHNYVKTPMMKMLKRKSSLHLVLANLF